MLPRRERGAFQWFAFRESNMANQTMIIIGAGIAGLSTGVYAQMNGYQSKILEMHTQPGGLCTSWKRQGYTIDGCIHWLVGSSPAQGLYTYWKEIGLIQGRQFIDHDTYMVFENKDGRVFHFYTDIGRLEKEMLRISPADEGVIKEFIEGVRFCLKINVPMGDSEGVSGFLEKTGFMLRLMPRMGTFQKWLKLTAAEFASRFKDPLLREALMGMWLPEFSVLFMLMTVAWMHQKAAGYPIGGSMPMIRAVERRYYDLGGTIQYGARVCKILVENGRAVGVRLDDGSEERADIVISAADGHTTIFNMLEGKYVDATIQGYYDQYKLFPPIILIGVGVNRTFENEAQVVSGLSYELEAPVMIAEKLRERLEVHIYNYDVTLAPEGKTVLTIILDSDFKYWKKLQPDGASYDAKKSEISETILDCLEQRWPGIAAQVEMIDVATPLTFERYTGNWQGSFEGWLMTPENGMTQMKKTLPGLEQFYMVGQWVAPGGGLPSGVQTGRQVISDVCKLDHKKFTTTIA
jgi:phytoene dehydrogenase-like protein